MRGLVTVFALFWLNAGSAAELTGRVVGITDGDTITVLDANRTQYKVRLAGIDAPESKQAFGARSKQSLSDLVYNQPVKVEWHKRDRYGRLVGKVLTVAPCLVAPCPLGRDANLAQVQAGMAWWYRDYAHEQTADDRSQYEAAENEARTAKRGLWSDAKPTPPSAWRRNDRH